MKKILLVFLFSIFLMGCSLEETTTTEETDIRTLAEGYREFSHLHLGPNAQLNQEYDVYYLYIYSPSCVACLGIKEEALSTIELLNNDVVFFVEAIYFSDLNDNIEIEYLPSIVKIVNNEVDTIIDGGQDVLEVLNGLT